MDGERSDLEKWAALRVDLAPGTYGVRVQTIDLGTYEVFLTVCDGWQTQLFLTFEQFWVDGVEISAPSLRRSSVFMAQSYNGFDPSSSGVRLSELAKQGLTQGRDIVSKDLMDRFLSGKFEYPFLGLVALQILMKRRRRNHELIKTVIRNLNNLLHNHPDLTILMMANEMEEVENLEKIEVPPTLAGSWEILTKATRRHAGLVSPNSKTAEIGHNVVTLEPWLIHRVPGQRSAKAVDDLSIAGSEEKFKSLLELDRDVLAQMASIQKQGSLELSQLEQSIMNLIVNNDVYSAVRQKFEDDDKNETYRAISEKLEEIKSTDAVARLRKLPAPKYSVVEAVNNLSEKLRTRLKSKM